MFKYFYRKLTNVVVLLKRIARIKKLRLLVKKSGKNIKVYGRVVLKFPEKIVIGSNVTLNENVLLGARGGIIIGDNTRISQGVIIETEGLDIKNHTHFSKCVTIGDNVWIASGAIVLPGVSIGSNSIIASGTVVTKNVSNNSIVKGVPGKITGTT